MSEQLGFEWDFGSDGRYVPISEQQVAEDDPEEDDPMDILISDLKNLPSEKDIPSDVLLGFVEIIEEGRGGYTSELTLTKEAMALFNTTNNRYIARADASKRYDVIKVGERVIPIQYREDTSESSVAAYLFVVEA